MQANRDVVVVCDLPAKLVVKAEPRKMEEDSNTAYAVNRENSRVSKNWGARACSSVANCKELLLS